MIIDIQKFRDYEARKLLTCREHPRGDLLIWNYTPVAQFSKQWDDVTLMARGLITDKIGHIVARPFSKFFNYGEYAGEIPNEPFVVHEKLDGSLGILYKDPITGVPSLATRGSFSSEQAIKGSEMLRKIPNLSFDEGYTYLFEIIYPSNRIVVDYGKAERLVLLAVIETETGRERIIDDMPWPDKAPRLYNADKLEELKTISRANAEGYVIHFDSGLRLKLKFDEYVRLHRLLTNVSSKNIWEYLKTGQPMDELLERVPDEFYAWVKETRDGLQAKHDEALSDARAVYYMVSQLDSRKEMALAMSGRDKTIKALVFAMLDNRGPMIDEIAWKAVKPQYERPFKEDIDG